jgi:hypothetical protein
MKISAEFEVEDSAFWQIVAHAVPRGRALPTALPPQKAVAEDEPTHDRSAGLSRGQ